MKMQKQLFWLGMIALISGIWNTDCLIMSCICSVGSMVIKGVKEV